MPTGSVMFYELADTLPLTYDDWAAAVLPSTGVGHIFNKQILKKNLDLFIHAC